MADDQGKEGQGQDIRDWLTGSTLPVAVAVLIGAAYVVSHLAVEEFYGPFGVSPEDAGLDRVTILVRSTALLAYIGTLAAVATLVLIWPIASVGTRLINRIRHKQYRFKFWYLLIPAATLTVLGFGLESFYNAQVDSDNVRHGFTIGYTFAGVPQSPYRSTVAKFIWHDGAPAQMTNIKCALVIGTTASYSLVYAPGVGTFRVTPDDALLCAGVGRRRRTTITRFVGCARP